MHLLFLLATVITLVHPKECYLPNNTNCPDINALSKDCDSVRSSPNINYTCPI